tara:strand:+ start:925 stop:1827 length:903 start_codon:yes stop_codon:yes gene_type:complete
MNRTTTAAFRAYARSSELTPVLLVEAEFTSGDVYLWTGTGTISYAGRTYTGASTLLNVQASAESLELRANSFNITLSGLDTAILSIALSEAYTGRPIQVKNAFISPQADQQTTFKVTASGSKFYIEDLLQPIVDVKYLNTYVFDVSDSSMSGHQFRLSTTSGGTHGGGSQYTTTTYTESGTSGTSGATATWVVPASGSFPTNLYYYCTNHSGMGGTVTGTDSLIVSDPYTIFDGFIDVMKVEDGGETANVSVACESSLIALERPKVRRYTPEDQAIDYPNDKGFEYVAALQDDEIIWGRG